MFVRTQNFTSAADITSSLIYRAKSVAPILGDKGLTGMKVDKIFDVPFSSTSNEAKQVLLGVDPKQVIEQYAGGLFHVADDKVIDYRPTSYTGFVHGTDALNELSQRIGFLKHGDTLVPRNRTSQFEHEAFAKGGKFDVDVGFEWSAFSPSIDSRFEMVRALCSNQMIFGKGTVMSRSIPMISDWESNMHVSNDVLKHIFHTTVIGRLADMPDERANLADARLLKLEIGRQLDNEAMAVDSRKFLNNLLEKVAALDSFELPKSMSVNDVKRIAVPMSVYDAMNIATEVTTHHSDGKPSNKLKAFAVSCIFDRKRQSNIISEEVFSSTNTFNDPDRAFWAETVH